MFKEKYFLGKGRKYNIMNRLYFTSDLHFCHDREFIWAERGFKSVSEMNETIIRNWNSMIDENDDCYVLGDIMLGDNTQGLECLKQLRGHIHIIRGNHDTVKRIPLYESCYNVVKVSNAEYIKAEGYNFYLSHYPTITANLDDGDKPLKAILINLYGHTHQKNNFYVDRPNMYHVGVDSHNCKPIEIGTIIDEIKEKMSECKKFM